MPPFDLNDLINTYTFYTKDDAEKLFELRFSYENSEEIVDSINEFFSSAQKQLETISAQKIVSRILPNNIKIVFAGMLPDTDSAEDILSKAKSLYEIVMRIDNRPIKLTTIYKYMSLVKLAMVLED